MKNHFFKSLLAALLLVFHLAASAEDTDLFVGVSPSAADLPNVLILLDNTANWNNAFTNEISALKTVIGSLPVNNDGTAKFRLGLMLFTETGGGNSGLDGGYVRSAVRALDANYKNKLVALLNSLDKLDDKSNGGKLGNAMADAYRYLTGGEPFSGNNKVKADYAGNTSGTAASQAIYALTGTTVTGSTYKLNGNALASKGATTYNSAVPLGSCGKAFIIYISNGKAQDNTSDTTAATDALKAAAGGGAAGTATAAAIALTPSGSQDNVGDEWARFMKKSSLGVVTYTIDVDKVDNNSGRGWSALLASMAKQSDGKYFDVASGDMGSAILKAMEEIFSEIQSVNSVFASVSLPVSVNTQGTYRNQVYIGVFRPDQAANPRWYGNLKQYRLARLNNDLKLIDAFEPTVSDPTYHSAINSNTGFITECARSYWSPTTVDNYWAFKPTGDCIAVANSASSNYPDGNIVDKGAQAYKLRSTTSRPLKTCSPVFTSCTTLTDFDNTKVTEAMLTPSGATTLSATERDALINWAHGKDVDDEHTGDAVTPTPSAAPTTSTVMRPSAHSDVVHSRPVAINFGTELAPKVVVFYGGNDGILRAVNGNRDGVSNNISGVEPGAELWSFIAPEFYQNIKRIRDNNIKINFPNNGIVSHTPLPKPYGVDGAMTAYKDNSNAWIYATMRRGGRVLYAFNVNVNDPADIDLKWKRGCPNQDNDTGCTNISGVGDFSGMGQTWSSPKAFTASGYATAATPPVPKPMLIMGGGYDTCEDADVNTCSAAGHVKKGNKVYVLDADTGVLLKSFNTNRSVVADIFVVPGSDGNAKHAYAVDLGGYVYRINIGTAAPADWTITTIASFGCDNPAANPLCASNRKFMFTPDVVENEGVYYLMLGSGDREKPLNYYSSTAAVQNYFFMFKDKPADPDWLSDESENCGGLELLCKASLYGIGVNDATPTDTQLSTKKGWYLGLRATEQVVTSAITIFNVTTFSTHMPNVPAAGSCTSTLGTASVYNIDYNNAKSANGTALRYQTVAGGGLPPSPVGGKVMLDDGTVVPFCIGCKPNSPLEGGDPPTPPTAIQPKARVYWYIEK
ncbi:MAG TPA: pilus assembly protein PilY [Noviherbaspirillum sp.]|nr:pilus assembly protein PilY [Noviherbaspirillum sp.]